MSDPANIFEAISRLCEEFQSQWRQGSPPVIEEFIERIDEPARESLLRNLLAAEIAIRRQRGEQPTSDDYKQRFSNYPKVIRQAFLESLAASTSQSLQADIDTADPLPTVSFQLPARRLGEYELLRELGRGGFGVVYEAVHMKHGNRVALKTLPTLAELGGDEGKLADRLHKFRSEFRALRDMNHPNLVGMQSLEADGPQWFFTMDLVEGVDFLDYVRPQGVLDEERLRPVFSQLVAGVMALHGQHIAHRDLKPSNVMVRADGSVVILDFGLSAELEKRATLHTVNFAGTPAYSAPEQADGEMNLACDWYSLGVMLYEALAGRRPFEGPAMQILRRKQEEEPPPITEGGPDDLKRLAMRMLQRNPTDRANVFEVSKAVSNVNGAEAQKAGAGIGQVLVGRESQLETLNAAIANLREKRPVSVFVSGRSGEGKSSLIDQFLAPLRKDNGLVVLSGRCYDRESVPFKALDSLIDALADYLKALPQSAAALLLPDDISFLTQLFPALRRVEVVAAAPAGRIRELDEQQIRQRAFGALRLLLERIGESTPVIMFIDDLQWGDGDSAQVMLEALRPPTPPTVMFLGSFRNDEAADSPFLNTWSQAGDAANATMPHFDVRVGPLSVEQCTEVMIARLGKDSEAVRRRAMEFWQESGGNPFFFNELVDCFDPSAVSFQPLSIQEVIARKLHNLPSDAEELLRVIAVAQQAIAIDELSEAAGHENAAVQTLTHMRSEQLVRLVGTEERQLVDTYHDRIRETILAALDESEARVIHLRLAEQLEARLNLDSNTLASTLDRYGTIDDEFEVFERVYDLAFHFDEAAQRSKSWIYNLWAAEQARRQFAQDVALDRYEIAIRNLDTGGNVIRFRIAMGLGETHLQVGNYDKAREDLDQAFELTNDEVQKARVEFQLASLAFCVAQLDECHLYCKKALNRLGNWVPNSKPGLAIGISREVLIQALHGFRPSSLHTRNPSEADVLRGELYALITRAGTFSSIPKTAWANLRAINFTERFRPSKALGYSYSAHSVVLNMAMGWSARADEYDRRAMAVHTNLNNAAGLAQSKSYLGLGAYSTGRFESSVKAIGDAVESLKRAGDSWELNICQFHLGLAHLALGDMAAAARSARETFEYSRRIGDSRSQCASYLWVRATEGQVPFPELRSCMTSTPSDLLASANLRKAEAYWLLCQNLAIEAVPILEEVWHTTWSKLHFFTHTVAAFPLLVRALREAADELYESEREQSRCLLRRALRVGKWAVRLTRMFQSERVPALRELGLAYAANGKPRKAFALLKRACEVAKCQGAVYDAATTELSRAQLKQRFEFPDADGDLRLAEQRMAEFEPQLRRARAVIEGISLD